MRRDDIFIIWGNGLKYLEEILNNIRDEYKIFYIIKHQIQNMESFIKDVYKCDTVPWEHLITKSRYLLKAPKTCFAVYVENNNAMEKYYGEGAFKHIQCAKVKATKERIRNLYNPKFPDGKRTEEHVIHATDYMEQTSYLGNYFGIPSKKERYKKVSGTHVEVNIELLKCNILGKGFIPLQKSPHYKYVLGDKEEYKKYIMTHLGTSLIHDHLPTAFDNLIDSFDKNKVGDITINNGVITDGLHRCSILLSKGITKLKVIQC